MELFQNIRSLFNQNKSKGVKIIGIDSSAGKSTIAMQANKTDNLSSGIVPVQKSLEALALKDWKNALNQAWNLDNPNRVLLYNIYDNIMIDSHLSSIVESRVLLILRSKFKIVNPNGENDTDITKLFENKWFNDFIKYAAESVFYGYSLTELNDFHTDNPFVNLISRRHVVPEFSLVKKEIYDDFGTSYSDKLSPYYIGIGDKYNLGLLMKAAPIMLAKKYAMASWSEYNEKFGIPFRKVTTPSYDDKRTDQLGQIMQNMGSAGWAVLREGEVLEFHEVSAGNAVTTFEGLIDRLNKEASKLILGQTATTEHGESGTYGSLQVMQDVAEDRHESDKTFIKYIINNELIPRLILHGYIKAGFTFEWDDTRELTTDEHIKMINDLNQNYIVPADYVTEKTGIPVQIRQTQQFAVTNEKKKSNFILNLPTITGFETLSELITNDAITTIANNLAKEIYDNKGNDINFNYKYFDALANEYLPAIKKTFGKNLNNIEYNHQNHTVMTMMEANIFRFSAAKDVAGILELNKFVRESESYNDFKQKAKKLFTDFNQNWLKTEYQNALATGLSASQYWEAMDDVDLFPYWQYKTADDSRVRNAHAKLHNMIFEAGKMGSVQPPNGWGCRCEFIKLDELPKGYKVSSETDAIQKLGDTVIDNKGTTAWEQMEDTGFNKNRAELAEAFTESQIYVKKFDESKLGITDMYSKIDDKGNRIEDYHKQFLWENLDKSKFTELKPTLKNNEEAKKFLDKKRNKNGDIVYYDYDNRPIQISKYTIDTHLSEKPKYKNRYKFVEIIDDILKNPDELWLVKTKETRYTYNYIKFYKQEPIVIIVEIEKGKLINIKTFLNFNDDSAFRKGILIKKYK